MTFQEEIINTIWSKTYEKIENLSNVEVGKAKKMSLETDGKLEYYRRKFLLPDEYELYSLFEKKNLKITPDDLVNILFRCRMLIECDTYMEYRQRTWWGSLYDEDNFTIAWERKAEWYEILVQAYIERAKGFLANRTLSTSLTMVKTFKNIEINIPPSEFLENIFRDLELPFSCNIDEDGNGSLGFTTFGSGIYCYWYSCQFMRSFLSILKIATFKFPGQINIWETGIEISPTISPVFLEEWTRGGFDWDENERAPFLKYPDGSLFRSFWHRSLSRTWLDVRNFESIKSFILDNRIIFNYLKNPWDNTSINDIAPTLDLLSSVTQAQDFGMKILLLYCSLEHLFVPKGKNTNNKEYIIGGIGALSPDLVTWFEDLYRLRNEYAHKWFISGKNSKILWFIFVSLGNIMKLLSSKLKAHQDSE